MQLLIIFYAIIVYTVHGFVFFFYKSLIIYQQDYKFNQIIFFEFLLFNFIKIYIYVDLKKKNGYVYIQLFDNGMKIKLRG